VTAINLPTIQFVRSPRAARTAEAVGHQAGAMNLLSLGLLLAALLVGSAVAIYDGRLHWLGMTWLSIALAALAGALILCRSGVAGLVRPWLVEWVAAIGVTFQLIHVALCGAQASPGASLPAGALLACTVVMAVGVLLIWRRAAIGLPLLLGAFAVAAFACIWTNPHPRIDVLMFQRESAAALLSGSHPYAVRYRDVYGAGSGEFYGAGVSRDGWLTYSFPYPPASLLLVLPAQALGDVRYGHAAAMIAAAALIAATGRTRLAALAAAALLTSPRTLFVVQNGWTEPLLIALAAATMFCASRLRGATWATLGLWVATKQYMILALPLLRLVAPCLGSRRDRRQTLLAAVLLAAAVTVPFAATEPRSFFRSVGQWQFVQPFRHDALSYPAMEAALRPANEIGRLGHATVPFAAGALAIALAGWKAPRTPGGLMAGAALVFFCFFAFNKQAFCNYYLFVIGLCCGAAAGLDSSERPSDQTGDRRLRPEPLTGIV
jgi:hypothetical protein